MTATPGGGARRAPAARRARAIRLLLTDIDGVLTDGRIVYGNSGEELKFFSALDETGLSYWRRLGGAWGVLTARKSALVARRARETGAALVVQGCWLKLDGLKRALARTGLAPEAVAYVGDDLLDLPVLRAVGFSACPADARPEVRAEVDLVVRAPGGRGAVREVIEHLMRRQGTWRRVIQYYDAQRLGAPAPRAPTAAVRGSRAKPNRGQR